MRIMSAVGLEFTTPIDFAKMYFDSEILYLPLESCHIGFLNQFSGAAILGLRTSIQVSEEEKIDGFQFSWFQMQDARIRCLDIDQY